MATKLIMNRLCCDKTTEHGADEIYIIVTGKRSNGETFAVRYPSEGQHYDMNDGKQRNTNGNLVNSNLGYDSHCITDLILCSVDILPGESWDIIVLIMEEDGGNTKTAQEIGAAFLANSGHPVTVLAGEILEALTALGVYKKDTDDYIGSFTMHASNNSNGQVTNSFRPIDRARVTRLVPGPLVLDQVEFRFSGDKTDYVGNFQFIL